MKFDNRDLPSLNNTDLTVENIRIVRDRIMQNRVDNTFMHTKMASIINKCLTFTEISIKNIDKELEDGRTL